MTIKQQGGIFGRNPTFNNVTAEGTVEASTRLTTPIITNGATAGTLTIGAGAAQNTGANILMYGEGHPQVSDFLFRAGTTGLVRIQDSGEVKIINGNLRFDTAGTGIDFSATSGTGTSELFDDYEEGTWTPVLTGSGSNPTGTVVAKYTKVGQVVSVEGKYVFSTAGSGNYALTFASLPFTVAAVRITGTFSLLDVGTAWYQGVCSGDGANVGFTTVAPVTFSSTTPFTVAASDELNFNFTYVTS